MIIFCDMDGVIADFVSGSLEASGIPLAHDDVDRWDYFEPYMTKYEFWKCIHDQKYFWEDLPVYAHAHDLVNMLWEHGEVVFCSDPTADDDAASGKVRWLKRHGFIGSSGTNYVMTHRKELLSTENTVLIDDYPMNLIRFNVLGPGLGLTFPQRWNNALGQSWRELETLIERWGEDD